MAPALAPECAMRSLKREDRRNRTDGDKYYRFSKDEKLKAITMEQADHLNGPWRDVDGFSLSKLQGYEGPECYLVKLITEQFTQRH